MSLPATIEDEPFKSYDDAIRAVRGVANSQGFAITIQRSERGPNNKVCGCNYKGKINFNYQNACYFVRITHGTHNHDPVRRLDSSAYSR
ncbi:hypothetical protein A9K55_006044 [Cordyceps militaris]|uniref:FAR1 domain-containing protein n=1 Tax=Cordyceps militaris TaxID=73501 RepID=A0A2H4SAS4_CORMI|nr:hypothetical protein A9K55_006044 [Cordyceps militaris]